MTDYKEDFLPNIECTGYNFFMNESWVELKWEGILYL